MTRALLLMIAMILAGCADGAEGDAHDRQQQYEAQAARQRYIEGMQRQCDAYGFQRGTNEYANCLMQLDQRNQANQDAFRRALILQQVQPLLRPPVR